MNRQFFILFQGESKLRSLKLKHLKDLDHGSPEVEKQLAEVEQDPCQVCEEAKKFAEQLLSQPVKDDSERDEQLMKDAKTVAEQAEGLVRKYGRFVKAITLEDI